MQMDKELFSLLTGIKNEKNDFSTSLLFQNKWITDEICYLVASQHVGKNENIGSDVVFSRV